jgi:hypothetical protein
MSRISELQKVLDKKIEEQEKEIEKQKENKEIRAALFVFALVAALVIT